MSEYLVEQEASWYEIAVAGRRFNIASRHGEAHIREIERLLNETFDEVSARVEPQSMLNIAFLTALNLADQLLTIRSVRSNEEERLSQRVETLVERLQTVLERPPAE